MYLPSWRYHASLLPRVISTPEEDAALGPDWAESPAAFVVPVGPAPEVPATDAPDETPRGKRGKKPATDAPDVSE